MYYDYIYLGPELWEEDDDEIDADVGVYPNIPPPDLRPDEEDVEITGMVKWITFLLLYFKTRFSVTDRAFSWLLNFLHILLTLFGKFSNKVVEIASQLPKTLHAQNGAFDTIAGNVDSFEKRAVCVKCHSLYTFRECIQGGTAGTINVCSYRAVKSRQNRTRCGSPLMKRIVSCTGSSRYYPHSVYCFSSLKSCLQTQLLRPGFVEQCESTRNSSHSMGLHDVYDGHIWKEFKTYSGSEFLSAPHNYAVLLNVDWLQPFVHLTYSVGVIYVVILNLPRLIRFKRENVILLGVIPGPSEPPLTINTYLAPIISDLLDLWKGVKMRLPDSTSITIRCALIGVSCDLPAARKVCGFLSHSANLGCSMCYAEFSEGFGSRNYSDFDRNNWRMRTNNQHRADIKKIEKAKTKTEQLKLVKDLGCRYSVLLDLPYFDPVRMLLIDPMHNLFLGSAKHLTLDILIRRGILSKEDLDKIEQRLKNTEVPIGLGRLPTRIDAGKFLTAEQWKNWTVYFSIFCLHGLIPSDQLECWRHFVLACRRLCKFSITDNDMTIADGLLLQFCKRVCRIYGRDAITPNCHMHCHLVSCIKNFGPFHSFWLFPFERYNGILGDQPNNNRSVELQFMRRFQRDNNHLQMIDQAKTWPNADRFLELIPSSSSLTSDHTISPNSDKTTTPGRKSILCTLSEEMQIVLRKLYSILYHEYSTEIMNGQIAISTVYRKYFYVTWKGHRLNSVGQDGTKNPYMLAAPVFEFTTSTSTINAIVSTESDIRPAQLQYFLSHSITLPGSENPKSHLLANCLWPMKHPQRFSIGKPVEVWCKDLFEPSSINTIIPVDALVNQVIISTDTILDEELLIVIPLLQ